jgi:hypothetical protein
MQQIWYLISVTPFHCQENRFAISALISCCVGQTSSLLSNGIVTLLAFCTNYDMNTVLLRGDVHAVDGSHHQLLPMKERPEKLTQARKLVLGHLKESVIDGGWQKTNFPMLRGK